MDTEVHANSQYGVSDENRRRGCRGYNRCGRHCSARSKQARSHSRFTKLAPRIDISDPQSILRFFAEVRDLDGVVSCAGDARFAPLDKLTDEDFLFSVNNKLMGQVNLIRAALPVIRDKGSITVTSGVWQNIPGLIEGAKRGLRREVYWIRLGELSGRVSFASPAR